MLDFQRLRNPLSSFAYDLNASYYSVYRLPVLQELFTTHAFNETFHVIDGVQDVLTVIPIVPILHA